MATPQENIAKFQEIANRGLQDRLDPDKRARFDEAVNRGIIQLPSQHKEIQPGQPQQELPQQDSLIDNARDVVGEFSASANKAAMWAPDTLVKGIRQLTGLPIKTPSEAIQLLTGYMPGEGGFMEPGYAQEAVKAAGGLVPAATSLTPVAGRNVASVGGAAADFFGLGASAPAAQQAAGS